MTDQTTQHAVDKPTKSGFFSNLPIGLKLGLGFGILVFLAFLGAGASYFGSAQASGQINTTSDVRVPVALLASKAQADLLRMEGDVRGYLALGDPAYREFYNQSSSDFKADLEQLKLQNPYLGAESKAWLEQLEEAYKLWELQPAQLFELRDDQFDREPAYRLLTTDGSEYAGQVLIKINTLIELQGQREPNQENLALMKDMANFQGNFSAMFSSLRGYVTTKNRLYRGEYYVNRDDNQLTWERLLDKKSAMTSSQRALIDEIATNRDAFLQLPDQLFAILEDPSGKDRLDLYQFTNYTVPLARQMREALDGLVADQQSTLRSELFSGRQSLRTANLLIVAGGVVALVVGLLMMGMSSAAIAQPIRRLTNVAEQIRGGDLDAQAKVESKDEIGVLASTFNNMTTKLRQTLFQVRKEKKRADDLLEVVIPIGVELTTERDFNRLLEKMLIEAKTFCKADAGLLLLATEQKTLRYAIVRNDTQKRSLGGTTGNTMPFATLPLLNPDGSPNHAHLATHVALMGETTNIPDMASAPEKYAAYLQSFSHDMALADYEIHSVLAIPLRSMEKTEQDRVNGVLLLLNAQDPEKGGQIPFDPNLQQMMESFSSLAVAALEAYIREQALRAEVAQLRIEIDKAKQQKAVEEIIDTDFFRDLQAKANTMRTRRRGPEA